MDRKNSCLTPSRPTPKQDIFLFAEADGRVQLTAATAPALVESDRTVSGLVIEFGPVGYTSVGPVRVPDATRLRIPEDISRIKLMDYHQSPPVAVGYCTALRPTDEGLRASFHVASTPAGDAALLDVQERVRDGLSVELGELDLRGDELLDSYLLGVALVPIPAWNNARHDGLAAARSEDTTTEGNTTMTPEQRARLAELMSKNGRTPEEEAEFSELITAAVAALAVEEQTTEEPAPEPALTASAVPAQLPAAMPSTVRTHRTSLQRPDRDIRELFAAQARVLSGHSRPELEAALSDITRGSNTWVSSTAYDGQLWSGLEYVRRWVANSMPGELSNYKGTGWKWDVKPEVGDYAGDKTAVPSNAPTTEATEWNAARLAGAHDLDRKFFDFGDEEFIAAYYAAMRESYAIKSDAKALAFQLASATAIAVAETSLFRAAAVAAQAVEDATGGAQVDFIYINSADRLGLLDITSADVPAYLETFGVTPDKFMAAPGVAAGTVVAGTRQATRFRELSETPIRVEAINVANGGIDGGVFGYYATELVFDGGIQSKTFA
jgi:hypothetical protein